jgi:zinc finger protein
MASENLFPSIGTLAQRADSSADQADLNDTTNAPPKDDDDRVVQEIESLCMNCEEQVSTDTLPHLLSTYEE